MLEPPYRADRVLACFAQVAASRPEARLVVANDGSLAASLQRQVGTLGLTARVQFVGRLDAQTQANWYARSRWFFSLPETDSVSVSVLEAMAHGCIPLLSDLPANRELVRDGDNGLIVADGATLQPAALDALLSRADSIARDNRAWIANHALFPAAVTQFLARLRELTGT
jgi:glycosyltransferase involved in cell wall biosynthesis